MYSTGGEAALDIKHGDLLLFETRESRLPARRMSMRKLKDVLRLRFELRLSHRQIARSCSIGLGTVHDYLQRATGAGVKWPLPEGWDEKQLESALFAAGQRSAEPKTEAEGKRVRIPSM